MKTKEELNALKEEVETLNRKLHELTDEELAQVSGGYEKFFYFKKLSETGEEEKEGCNVAVFPGMTGFP